MPVRLHGVSCCSVPGVGDTAAIQTLAVACSTFKATVIQTVHLERQQPVLSCHLYPETRFAAVAGLESDNFQSGQLKILSRINMCFWLVTYVVLRASLGMPPWPARTGSKKSVQALRELDFQYSACGAFLCLFSRFGKNRFRVGSSSRVKRIRVLWMSRVKGRAAACSRRHRSGISEFPRPWVMSNL